MLTVDRAAAARYGITLGAIDQTLYDANGLTLGEFKDIIAASDTPFVYAAPVGIENSKSSPDGAAQPNVADE